MFNFVVKEMEDGSTVSILNYRDGISYAISIGGYEFCDYSSHMAIGCEIVEEHSSVYWAPYR